MSGFARMSRRFGALGLVLATALLIVGCGGGGSDTAAGPGTESNANAKEAGDGGTLRFALESQPATLNPSRAIESSAVIVANQVFEGLYEIDEEGKPVPNLAAGVKTSSDGLTWTFTLQEGVNFSDGKPMTSKDVVFSLEEAKTSPYFASLYEGLTKLTAPSPDTVVIKVKAPNPALLAQLAFYNAYIVPDNYAGMTEKEFAQAPIGTGPYMVTSGKRGGTITAAKNTNYWKPNKPHFDQLVFSVTTEEDSRFQQIRGGDIDMAKATAIGAKTGVVPGTGVRVEETTPTITNYMMLNQNNPLFENDKVRAAVNLALDREGIVQTATAGAGELGASFLSPAVTYSILVEPPKQNIEKAKELIAEATKEGVNTSEGFTVNSYNFDAYSGLATQIVQQNLEEIGLNATLQPLDEAALNELLENGKYDVAVGFYVPALSDPSELSAFYVGFFAPAAGQDVPVLTKLVDEGATETNEAKREKIYAELQEALIEEEGILILGYQPIVYPMKDQVTGVEFDTVGHLLLRNAGFAG